MDAICSTACATGITRQSVGRYGSPSRAAGALPSWLKDWKGDGIIARVDSPQIAAALRRTGLPVVDVSAERFASEFPRVSVDNAAVARLAAEHLLGKGFRNFAYFGDPQFLWARQRGVEFQGGRGGGQGVSTI